MLLPAFSTDPYHMRISGGIYGMVSQGGDPDSIFNQVTGPSQPRPNLRRSTHCSCSLCHSADVLSIGRGYAAARHYAGVRPCAARGLAPRPHKCSAC